LTRPQARSRSCSRTAYPCSLRISNQITKHPASPHSSSFIEPSTARYVSDLLSLSSSFLPPMSPHALCQAHPVVKSESPPIQSVPMHNSMEYPSYPIGIIPEPESYAWMQGMLRQLLTRTYTSPLPLVPGLIISIPPQRMDRMVQPRSLRRIDVAMDTGPVTFPPRQAVI